MAGLVKQDEDLFDAVDRTAANDAADRTAADAADDAADDDFEEIGIDDCKMSRFDRFLQAARWRVLQRRLKRESSEEFVVISKMDASDAPLA